MRSSKTLLKVKRKRCLLKDVAYSRVNFSYNIEVPELTHATVHNRSPTIVEPPFCRIFKTTTGWWYASSCSAAPLQTQPGLLHNIGSPLTSFGGKPEACSLHIHHQSSNLAYVDALGTVQQARLHPFAERGTRKPFGQTDESWHDSCAESDMGTFKMICQMRVPIEVQHEENIGLNRYSSPVRPD